MRELDRIREVVVHFNTRLVKSIAGRRYRGSGFHDLTQEGNLGLMRAYDRYDYLRGYKFSTLATWWIRQFIKRAIHEYGLGMHVPVHKHDLYRKVDAVLAAADADPDERVRVDALGEVEYVCRRFGLEHKEVYSVMVQMKRARTVSLSQPIGLEGESELIDVIADRSLPPTDYEAVGSDLNAKLSVVLSWLAPRDAEMMRRRFGLSGRSDSTLAGVSELYPPGKNSSSKHLSRERVRQVEFRALRRIRRRLLFDERQLGAELRDALAAIDGEGRDAYQGM